MTLGYGGRGYHQGEEHDVMHSYAHGGKPKLLSREEFQRRRDHDLCLYCAKPGHQAWECPVKKEQPDRMAQRQTHITVAKGSKGSSPGKGKSRPSGKGKGKGHHGHIRKFDAHRQGDPDHEYVDGYQQDDYDDYEQGVVQDPTVGMPAHRAQA